MNKIQDTLMETVKLFEVAIKLIDNMEEQPDEYSLGQLSDTLTDAGTSLCTVTNTVNSML